MNIASPVDPALVDLQVVPALILDTSTDEILVANATCEELFGVSKLTTRPFSSFVDASVQQMMLFLQEAEHRGSAWTRNVMVQTEGSEPLSCEIRGRYIETATDCVLLTFIDLDEMEKRTRQTEAAYLHRDGLMAWQRGRTTGPRR